MKLEKNILSFVAFSLIFICSCKKNKTFPNQILYGYTSFSKLSFDSLRKKIDSSELHQMNNMFVIDSQFEVNVGKSLDNSICQINTSFGSSKKILYGHQFIFDYRDDSLYRYDFLTSPYSSSYKIRQCDSATTNYLELGTPYVDFYTLDLDKNKDSIFKVLCFSTFPRKKLKVEISCNGNNFKQFEIVQSKRLPYLMEGTLSFHSKLINPKFIIKIVAIREKYDYEINAVFRETLDTLEF
jgi:hypothetical protein